MTRNERGASKRRPNLEQTLFRRTVSSTWSGAAANLRVQRDEIRALERRILQLENALAALQRIPSLEPVEVRAALSHTRLLCRPTGYSIDEVDQPPPPPGSAVFVGGHRFDVVRLGPSPFPDDPRRCAILAPTTGSEKTERTVWRTAVGLRVGDGVPRLHRLYARATPHRGSFGFDAGPLADHTTALPDGRWSGVPALLARTQRGRVAELVARVGICD